MADQGNEWLQKLRENDETALKAIFDAHYSYLFQVIRRIIPDGATSEDLAQEVFIKLWEKRDKIEIHGALRPYLRRMAVNEALGYLRKHKKQVTEDIEEQFDLSAESVDAQDIMQYKEVQDAVDAAIDKLPPKCRAVFMLSRYDGYSYKEIGAEMEISVKTVENQISKALRLLRGYLKRYLPLLLILTLFL